MGAPVAEVQRDRPIRLARHDPQRHDQAVAVDRQRGGVDLDAVDDRLPVADAERLRGARADVGDVVPANLVERLGQLLQPAVVGEAAVVDRRVGVEGDLEPGRLGLGRRRSDRAGGQRHRLRRERAAGNVAVVQHAPPELLEAGEVDAGRIGELAEGAARRHGAAVPVRLPEALDDLERGLGLAGERGDHFVRRTALVERLDQRLAHRHRAVGGAGVAPRLEVVRLRDVPLAVDGGLVAVQAEMDGERHLAHGRRELQIGRRREHRVGAEDHQDRDGAGVHLADQIAQPGQAFARVGLRRLRVDDGGADVAERGVHRVRQHVDSGRLAIAGDDQRAAAMRLQILDDLGGEAGRRLRRLAGGAGDTEPGGNRPRQGRNVARLQRQAVVGLRAGVGRNALGDVEPGHLRGARADPPPRREVPGVAQLAGAGIEQVGVQREDHVGLVEAIDGLDVLAEGLFGAGPGVVRSDRFVLNPLGLRHGRQQALDLRPERG